MYFFNQLIATPALSTHLASIDTLTLELSHGLPSVAHVNALAVTLPQLTSLTIRDVRWDLYVLGPLVGLTRLTELNMFICWELTTDVLLPLMHMKSLERVRITDNYSSSPRNDVLEFFANDLPHIAFNNDQ